MPGSKSMVENPPESRPSIFELMGQSFSVQQIHRQIQRVARTDFTVIVHGETGTGKELVARLIHEYSKRATKPFVAVDCGAIPDSIVESELFGYVKGAFTGADGKKAGYFEMAKGGTLFLDEIANLSPGTQMKLLRSLQERRILPLGSERNLHTDVRIIVASNCVLEDEVKAGRFRADLFHRLNEFMIYLVPLRERREDIMCLADRFRREANFELGKDVQGCSAEAQAYLLRYEWPGNVRELRNTIRRAVLLSNEVIELKHLRQVLSAPSVTPQTNLDLSTLRMHQGHSLHDIVRELTSQLEKTLIQHALQESGGNKSQASRLLKIGYKTLYRKLKEHDID
jgi:DNA-binding NtrC family response regulator